MKRNVVTPAKLIELSIKLLNDNTINDYSDYYHVLQGKIGVLEKEIKSSYGDEVHELFKKDKDRLYDVYRKVLKGNLQSASTTLHNWFYNKDVSKTMTFEIKAATTLFRCRNVIDEKSPFDVEMFHVPFDKRHKVGNERFSISGFPCLYLSDSIDCCKKEIGAEGSNCFIAKYTLENDVQYYDFSFNDEYRNLSVNAFLRVVLLMLFCTINICNKHSNKEIAKFFPYYVIPQLITSSISTRNDMVRCIKYESTIMPKCNNYVFIPKLERISSKIKFDQKLKSMFTIERLFEKRM